MNGIEGDQSFSLALPMVCRLVYPASADALPGNKNQEPAGNKKKCQISTDAQEGFVCCRRTVCALINASVLNQRGGQFNFVTFLMLMVSPIDSL